MDKSIFWGRISRYHLLLISIILLTFGLRMYNVTDRPHDLFFDEVAIGYNAYSILKTGKDEYGNFLPISFRSFNDYKLPFYIYATSITEAVFGKNAFAVRIPAIIFGSATVIFFMALVKLLTGSHKQTLLCGLLLAISPWHLQFSRAAFEATVALFFIVLGTYLIFLALIAKKSTFFWGLISLIISIYTYHTPRLIVPLLLLAIFFLYKKNFWLVVKQKHALLFLGIILLLSLPLLIYISSPAGWARFQLVSLFNDYHQKGTQSELAFWGLGRFWENYIANFSFDFLFFAGDSIGRHSVREMGMNYVWQLPFFLIGLFTAVKNKTTTQKFFLAWLIISPIAAALATPNPHAIRAISPVISIIYFISLGLWMSTAYFKHHAKLFLSVISIFLGFFVLLYLHIYYVHYPQRTAPDWLGGYKQAMEYITAHQQNYDRIAVTDANPLWYIYVYFYGPFTPSQILTQKDPQHQIGKFMTVGSPFTPNRGEKTLYVAQPIEKWNGHLVTIIYDHGEDEVFKLWEN